MIQQKQVSIQPALLIAFQAVLGLLFGFLGAAVASPLLAATKVGVEEAYIKDVLESDSSTDKTDPDEGVRDNFHDEDESEQSSTKEAADVLQETLNEEGHADQTLTRLAELNLSFTAMNV